MSLSSAKTYDQIYGEFLTTFHVPSMGTFLIVSYHLPQQHIVEKVTIVPLGKPIQQ